MGMQKRFLSRKKKWHEKSQADEQRNTKTLGKMSQEVGKHNRVEHHCEEQGVELDFLVLNSGSHAC